MQFKRWQRGDAPAGDRKWELVKMAATLTLHLLVSITLDHQKENAATYISTLNFSY